MFAHARTLAPLALLLALGPAPVTAEEAAPEPAPESESSPDPAGDAPAGSSPVVSEALPPEVPGKVHAWSESVSEQDREAADALFQQGNALMRDSVVISAAAKYREALAHWDHPNIHYNLAIALMALDQPVETYEHLQSAMRHGPAPLQQERFEHAKNYLTLLDKQVARVSLRCDTPGATVELDGKKLFDGPGQYQGLIRAGSHTLVASKEGLVTNHSVRVFEGGKTTELDLQLRSMTDLTEIHQRFPRKLPWTIMGAGAAIALAGGGLHYWAVKDFDEVDSKSRHLCPHGCDAEPAELASKREHGKKVQRWAIVGYAVGGTAIAAGGLLAYLNRTEVRVRSYDGEQPSPAGPGEQVPPPKPEGQAALELVPVLDPEAPGVAVSFRF